MNRQAVDAINTESSCLKFHTEYLKFQSLEWSVDGVQISWKSMPSVMHLIHRESICCRYAVTDRYAVTVARWDLHRARCHLWLRSLTDPAAFEISKYGFENSTHPTMWKNNIWTCFENSDIFNLCKVPFSHTVNYPDYYTWLSCLPKIKHPHYLTIV